MNLADITADDFGDNAAIVDEIRRAVAGLDDGTPFLMLPLRIETRFMQREVAGGGALWRAADFEAGLQTVISDLEAISRQNLRTDLVGTVKQKAQFKGDVEDPLYAFLTDRIGATQTAVSLIGAHVRDAPDGTDADADSLERSIARARLAFVAAEQGIAQLRSAYQRQRFVTELRAVEAQAHLVLAQLRSRVLPAMRLLRHLRTGGRIGAAHGPGAALPRVRLADTAEAFHGAQARLLALSTALGEAAAAPGRLTTAADTARQAVAQAQAIGATLARVVLVPAAWKSQLQDVAKAACGDARRIAAVLARGTSGGGLAVARYVELARTVRAAADSLSSAINAIRSDDPELNDRVPERWRDAPVFLPGDTHTVDELWVRIFPDDIGVETHEAALTDSEIDSGRTFWIETLDAGDDDGLKRGAWRALCRKHGSRRAAWIANQLEPQDAEPSAEAVAAGGVLAALTTLDRRIDEVASSAPGERGQALVRAAEGAVKSMTGVRTMPVAMVPRIRARIEIVRAKLAGLDDRYRRADVGGTPPSARLTTLFRGFARWEKVEGASRRKQARAKPRELAFPDVPRKDRPWTRAPSSGVLPPRFVVVAVNRDRVAHLVAANEIPPDLRLGLDPDPADPETERYGLDENGNLVVGDAIRWMVDFDEAIRKGMAVRMPITADEARAGFDRVYVVGVRTDGADEGGRRVEALLEGHHYGQTGLALLPIGTPTNNSEREAAGYSSDDDPDASYDVERAGLLFDPVAPTESAADGLRVARALGVDPAAFGHVVAADGRDVSESLVANAALWPATFGSYLDEFFGALMPTEVRDWIAEYALGHVSARGQVPSIRVGEQPYGILPTTAFSLYVPATGEARFADGPGTADERRALFNRLLRDVLLIMHDDWSALRVAYVKHAHSPGVVDFQQHVLGMLGLEATSATCEYRFALNCAGRQPPALVGDLLLSFGVPRSSATSGQTSADYGPVALLERFPDVFRDALNLGPGAVIVGGQVGDAFVRAYKRLLHSRAYEVRHLRGPKPLNGAGVGPDAATWIPQLLAAAPRALAEEARAGGHDRPLLYLLLRQALLIQLREAALRIVEAEHMLTDEARRLASSSDVFLVSTLSKDYAVTPWNYLFSPLSDLDGRFGIVFPQGVGSLYRYLTAGAAEQPMDAFLANRGDNLLFRGFVGRAHLATFIAQLTAHAAAVDALAQIPADRLERLLFEHLDLVSYRLDAWLTGLAQKRLTEMRARTAQGIYVGAYGWVENLRPAPTHPIAENVPAALMADTVPIHSDPENQGFIHGPSLNHAVTAAILRSGYLSEAQEIDVENRMAVNLSSSRVRLALGIIDGVRAGNDLGSLLGYQFERVLHESFAADGVTLDDLIAPFRRAFPAIVSVDPTLSPGGASKRLVVDGLALLQTVESWMRTEAIGVPHGATVFDVLYDSARYTGYPFDIHGDAGEPVLPPQTTGEDRRRLDGVLRAIDRIANALDAVGDLVVAESVYQIAQGNHARAAAAIAALGEGSAPPRPEIVDTPRTGTTVSQRLLFHVVPVTGRRPAMPAQWVVPPATPRAVAEPSLNRWLGERLGPPDAIRARLFDADGAVAAEVSVEDLGLQPIDLFAILGRGLDEGVGELSARLLDVVRPADLDDEHPPGALRVDLDRDEAWGDAVRSITEIAPILESAWELVTRGRPASAHDWVLEETATDGGGAASGSDDGEFGARVSAALEALRAAGVALLVAVSGGADNDPDLLSRDPRAYVTAHADVYMQTVDGKRVLRDVDAMWAIRDDLATALSNAAAFGVPHVDPPISYISRVGVLVELLEKIEAGFIEVATRVQRADALIRSLATAARGVDVHTAVSKAIFGDAFVMLPLFRLRNPDEIARVFNARLAPPDDPGLDGWLQGVAAVRANAACLARLLVLDDAFGVDAPAAVPVQLPYRDGDLWLGAEVPDDAPASDCLSIVAFGVDALNIGGANAAIVVDQWTEVLPSTSETTGIAIHYDQPDARPPQSLLVVVPPQARGRWRWDDLLVSLHDTFEVARNRTVELEHLQHDLYGQILPGIVGELVPEAIRSEAGEVPGSRVIVDFGQNNPVQPVA